MKHLSQILVLLFITLCSSLFATDSKLYSYTYEMHRGWNLIGVFLEPSAASAETLLAHQVYEFKRQGNDGVFCQAEEIAAGKVYWVHWDDETPLLFNGYPVQNLIPEGTEAERLNGYRLTDGFSVASGVAVTRSAPEVQGYSFTGWSVSGLELSDVTAKTISFSMPANSVKLTPNYSSRVSRADNGTATESGEMVTISTRGSTSGQGQSSYTYSLRKGWNLIGIFLEPAKSSVSAICSHKVYEFKIQDSDGVSHQVDTVAAGKAYWILCEAETEALEICGTPVDGLVPVSEDADASGGYRLTEMLSVSAGCSVKLTAAELEGHVFTGWEVSGVTLPDKTAKTITFTMPANDVTLSPNYKKSGSGTGGTYLVVNLSDGSYRYTETAPDLTDDTCRTTELWLRRIPAGIFTMGSPMDEVGKHEDETLHIVTLTEDFYIGVFEMTQRQYELIYGSNPSYWGGDTRPVEHVSYNTIRGSSTGAGWPSSHDVDSDSFLGKLRSKTGLTFDLPTEAQWEYACRAGTTTALNTGKDLTSTKQDSAMDEAGRYWYNGGSSSQHTKVGSYLPNNWGLYDMHGNEDEWCLDWYQSDLGRAAVTDPVGATSGSDRVVRGGHWGYGRTQGCRSAARYNGNSPSSSSSGFRVVCVFPVQGNSYVLTVDGVEETVCHGTPVSKTAPAKEGYSFTGWTVTGVAVDDKTANPISFTMPDNNVTLTPNYLEASTLYLVVNLVTGSRHYSGNAPDLTNDTCRTTELWLRRIPKGTFAMGSPVDEVGGSSDDTQHQVTLTEDFYIGVFEMTQRQYALIYGSNPSYYKGDTRPVETVSYNTLRGSSTGAGWPSSHDVDSDSFLGKLRSKTGMSFDLPTEAQWEYACRAGTTTALNTGKNLTNVDEYGMVHQDSAMDEAGRYRYNESDGKGGYSEHTTKVGSYLPNSWGLYDMHGNVCEWCLDWSGSYSGDATDPKGATSGSYRVARGGHWDSNAQYCRSASPGIIYPSGSNSYVGFRVVMLP